MGARFILEFNLSSRRHALNSSAFPFFLMGAWPRRSFLRLGGLAFSGSTLALASALDNLAAGAPDQSKVNDLFPTQSPDLAREMVKVSHFDLNRVKELAEAQPSLARAAWDWGFGDWETALGAASHMGNRPIAEYLIARGARPSLFSAAMLGHLEVVKAFVAAQPGVQRIRGPHGISLLAHAKAGGEASHTVFAFLESIGDAGADAPAPLAQSDVDAIMGVYAFGPAENDHIDVTAEKGTVTWTRRGSTGRPLFHLGERMFYPSGAPAVRIQFSNGGEGEMLMTIRDPGLVLTARRQK
jgi:hypothetical protein